MSKEKGIKVLTRELTRTKHEACRAQLVVYAACSGCCSFNNLLYKEWVTTDDKDCSIIPITLRRYREKKQSYRNVYYFVNIICCFKNKDDDLLLISMFINKLTSCMRF